ncbi:SDR family oxidoreductase [Sphingobacterium deserti]|uniref:3-oxoacyl-(Acyl-carrier-protein) reductase n=1 Tax=Sphingobacterium deserti TaxID=1229276 RepID=A0A0B8T2D9_9SPHI|nr:SDR family oxidoreductase [Sphingobacterium deserti]KGE15427.1 3-oxoacyl-(acyl-carrier-protein) reductase [Sphingobacterium deserti]
MNILERFSLKGKVIVVTGGTGILGKAFVKALAEAGCKICIIGRNEERANERVRLVNTLGAEGFAVVADVMDEQSMRAAREQILAKWGTIDGLINAAGGNIPGATIGPDESIFDNKIADTIKAIELNLYGTIIPTMIFGEVMANKGAGSIINISSLASSRPFTRVLGYTVAKHGVDGFTKWMSAELALRYTNKIRVNAIAPGVFLTEQNRTLLTNPDGSYTDRANKFVQGTPFSRLGDPSELEGTLIYLLSDASAFVTGETIFVDGGFNSWSGV